MTDLPLIGWVISLVWLVLNLAALAALIIGLLWVVCLLAWIAAFPIVWMLGDGVHILDPWWHMKDKLRCRRNGHQFHGQTHPYAKCEACGICRIDTKDTARG